MKTLATITTTLLEEQEGAYVIDTVAEVGDETLLVRHGLAGPVPAVVASLKRVLNSQRHQLERRLWVLHEQAQEPPDIIDPPIAGDDV